MKISSPIPSFKTIKDELVNSTLLGLVILIVPALASSIYRSVFEGWQNVYLWHILASIFILSSWIFRKHLGYRFRGAVIVTLFYLTGLSGFYSFGLQSLAMVYFVFVILFSVILFGYLAAFFSILVCLVSIFAFYFAFHKGILVIHVDLNAHHRLLVSWISAALSFLMFAVMITLLLGKLHEKLNETLLNTHNSEEKFRRFFENSLDAIIVSKNGKLMMINDAFLTMFGYEDRAELIGLPLLSFFEPTNREKIIAFMSKRKSGDRTDSRYKDKGMRKNGEVFDFEAVITTYHWEGEMLGLSIIRDISDQQRFEAELIRSKEKAEESDRLKSSFLANMSHEIRTPMNAIIGFSDFLSDPDLLDEKRKHFTKIIKSRTYDLLHIVEDILDVSKIEVGQMELCATTVVLSDFMYLLYQEYTQKIKDLEEKKDILLKLTLAHHTHISRIWIDEKRFRQIFVNLLENALKFTHQGSIEFGFEQDHESNLVFYVKDTGIGISRDKHEMIFDRFRQADESINSRLYGGTGLGLAIVNGIVKLMKGRVWLESEENKGTTFYFTFPIQICTEGTELSLDKSSRTKKTVLIVEDNEANMEYLKEVLSDTGLIYLDASTGEQALEIFAREPEIDLVLMDIQLPDINGLVLTKQMKTLRPDLVVIAQTAYATPSDIEKCKEAGCTDYIAKPMNRKNLISIIIRNLDLNLLD